MYFLVLSQAPPVLLIDIANYTPVNNIPTNNPGTKIAWKRIPKNKGVNITIKAGTIIICKEALVATAIHL